MTNIFISHSSKTPLANYAREKLRERLRRAGVKILLDEGGVDPGEEWRAKILDWLGVCHAAVILFSPEAVENSSWVWAETTILCWRHAINPQIKIVPVLFEGVNEEDSRLKTFEPVRLGEIQFVKPQAGKTGYDAIDDMVEEVGKALDGFSSHGIDDSMAEWVNMIDSAMGSVGNASLSDIAVAIKMNLDHMPAAKDEKRLMIARQLLLSEPDTALSGLSKLLRNISCKDNKERLVELTSPIWVPHDSVRNITPVIKRDDQTRRNVLINGKWIETALECIYRATCKRFIVHWIFINDESLGHEEVRELVSKFRNSILNILDPGQRWRKSGLATQAMINGAMNNDRIVAVVFQGRAIEFNVPSELRDEFKGLLFVLLSTNISSDAASSGLADVEIVSPTSDESQEVYYRQQIDLLMNSQERIHVK